MTINANTTDRRVVITGLGPITPLGIGVEAFWDSVRTGRSGIGPITSFDASGFESQLGGQVPDFNLKDYVPELKTKARQLRKKMKIMARDIQMGCAASILAVDDAGLKTAIHMEDQDQRSVAPQRLGVNLGSCLIAADLDELAFAMTQATDETGHFSLKIWGDGPMKQLFPLWLLKYLPNLVACHVTILHEAHGPCNTVTSAEVASHMAVGEALRVIHRGAADVMMTGGFECKINGMGMIRQILLNRLTPSNELGAAACKPFDVRRNGCVAAEGGGCLVLELLDHARDRGVPIYGEVLSFATTHAASRPDQLDRFEEAIANAIRIALEQAKVVPEQIGLLIPHGEANVEYDRMEARAIHAALGEAASSVPVSPSRGAVGNLAAGNGAIDLMRAALALRHGIIPKAVNCEQPDPECGLNIVQESCPLGSDVAVVSGYSWAGQAAALVLKRFAE